MQVAHTGRAGAGGWHGRRDLLLAALAAAALAGAPWPSGVAGAAQQTGTMLLSVTVLPVVEVEVPTVVQLGADPGSQQATVAVTVRSNAPWQLELSPQEEPSGLFAVPGRLRWRVADSGWQDVASPLGWQASQPTGQAGETVTVAFQYNPSFDDAPGEYTLSIAVTASALIP